MLTNTDRVNISSVMMRSGFNEYRSTLNLTTLSSTEDSGTFTCIVTTVPAPAYKYVMTSTNYRSVNLTVTGKFCMHMYTVSICINVMYNSVLA